MRLSCTWLKLTMAYMFKSFAKTAENEKKMYVRYAFVWTMCCSCYCRVVKGRSKSIENGTFGGAATKFGMGDYVGDATQYLKWHVNRFRGYPTKGWNVNGLCFFVCSSAQLGVKPMDWFWRVMSQNACFWKYCIPLGVRTTISQFQGVKIPRSRQKLVPIGIFQPKCWNLTMAISPKL